MAGAGGGRRGRAGSRLRADRLLVRVHLVTKDVLLAAMRPTALALEPTLQPRRAQAPVGHLGRHGGRLCHQGVREMATSNNPGSAGGGGSGASQATCRQPTLCCCALQRAAHCCRPPVTLPQSPGARNLQGICEGTPCRRSVGASTALASHMRTYRVKAMSGEKETSVFKGIVIGFSNLARIPHATEHIPAPAARSSAG